MLAWKSMLMGKCSQDNKWPEAGDALFDLETNAGGLPEQLLQEESS